MTQADAALANGPLIADLLQPGGCHQDARRSSIVVDERDNQLAIRRELRLIVDIIKEHRSVIPSDLGDTLTEPKFVINTDWTGLSDTQ